MNDDLIKCFPLDRKEGKWHLPDIDLKYGSGQHGSVWAICKLQICSYVMKIVNINKENTLEGFEREVRIQSEVAEKGLTIPVEDSWVCDGKGVIIMAALDITLRDFLLELNNGEDVVKTINQARKLLNRLHSIGFYHGDNHFNNFMLRRVTGDEPGTFKTRLGRYKIYLIDFGAAGWLQKPGVSAIGKRLTKDKRIREDLVVFSSEEKSFLVPFVSEFRTIII